MVKAALDWLKQIGVESIDVVFLVVRAGAG